MHPSTTTRPEFGLTLDLPAREAVRRIALHMLRLARRQERAMIADLDPECLHRYRVSLRRIRSVLAVTGDCGDGESARLRGALRSFGRATNRLRDLDVQLQAETHYATLLPEALHPGLALMMAGIRSERSEALARVRQHLQSQNYDCTISEIDARFACSDALPPCAGAPAPIGPLVARRVMKRHRRIRKAAKELTLDSPDSDFHRVRLHAKKLRYLLEFFGELLDEPRLAQAVTQLKQLQDRLGDFNDTRVQEATMMHHVQSSDGTAPPELLLAVGGLVSALHDLRADQRHHARKAIHRFGSSQVRRELRALVAPLQ